MQKIRGIKDYKSKSEDELVKILSEPKPKINFSKLKIEEIRKKVHELMDRFSKPKIKEIRKNIYEIEKNLFELKKYYA